MKSVVLIVYNLRSIGFINLTRMFTKPLSFLPAPFLTRGALVGIIWKDDQVFFTGGKDSQLIQHSYKDAVRIVPNLAALDMNPGNCVTLAVSDKLCSSQGKFGGNLKYV